MMLSGDISLRSAQEVGAMMFARRWWGALPLGPSTNALRNQVGCMLSKAGFRIHSSAQEHELICPCAEAARAVALQLLR